jgi:hypothetical protein
MMLSLCNKDVSKLVGVPWGPFLLERVQNDVEGSVSGEKQEVVGQSQIVHQYFINLSVVMDSEFE